MKIGKRRAERAQIYNDWLGGATVRELARKYRHTRRTIELDVADHRFEIYEEFIDGAPVDYLASKYQHISVAIEDCIRLGIAENRRAAENDTTHVLRHCYQANMDRIALELAVCYREACLREFRDKRSTDGEEDNFDNLPDDIKERVDQLYDELWERACELYDEPRRALKGKAKCFKDFKNVYENGLLVDVAPLPSLEDLKAQAKTSRRLRLNREAL